MRHIRKHSQELDLTLDEIESVYNNSELNISVGDTIRIKPAPSQHAVKSITINFQDLEVERIIPTS